ncbi:MAG TPA: MEKHLA domain-containing protein [Caulobacteraceae bacterium]|nr:MEKHLA domain-containing protein [Caulobacteraceae bacterium]
MTDAEAQAFLAANAGTRLALIAASHARLTGRPLVAAAPENLAAKLWTAPFGVLAHGTEADPVFFYANRLALELFELTPQALIAMPSRLSAEPGGEREARARFMRDVTQRGFADDYAGVRVSSTGRRFRIEAATVWNLVDTAGRRHGQAAAFSRWTPLAPV